MESNRGGNPDLEDSLRAVFIASSEDIVVHGYEIVNVAIVREIVEQRLDDLLRFVTFIRAKLP